MKYQKNCNLESVSAKKLIFSHPVHAYPPRVPAWGPPVSEQDPEKSEVERAAGSASWCSVAGRATVQAAMACGRAPPGR
jgi:hypothetical protein